MLCSECQTHLSDYIDNDLAAATRLGVEEHLAGCQRCETVHDDLARIVQASSTLPLHTPSSQIWSRIQREVSTEPAVVVPFLSRRFSFSFSARQLTAAAALVLSMTFLGALALRSSGPTASPVGGWGDLAGEPLVATPLAEHSKLKVVEEFAGVAATLEQMQRSVVQRRDSWSPQLRENFDRQLAALDSDVSQSVESCRDARADVGCRERLSAAYQAKLRFLEEFAKAGQ